ncbi:MAG: outer membrane protein assembly factor BamA [Candidatus Omnitrophica bacterium]|nr:outer membrane protein assembly factor BamA [Candidatus Omnitrophota bacterium]
MNNKISLFSSSLTIIFLIILFFHPLAGSSYAQDSETKTSGQITDIEIEGNKVVSTTTVLSKIKIRKGDRFLQKAVNEDIKRLYATGFFTDVSAEVEEYKEGIRLIYSVSEKSLIDKIVFEGNKVYKEEALKKQIDSKDGDVLNRRRLSEDIKKIKSFYQKKGFPLIEIDYDVDVNVETNKAIVYIRIDEQKRYKIKKIEFKGNDAFNNKRLLKVIATRPDTLFTSGVLDEEMIDQDMLRLEAFYKNEGYIDVEATNKIDYDETKEGIYINITVKEGARYFVGNVGLEGNQIVTDKDIRKELKMVTGKPYNPNNLRLDVISIQTLYFDRGYMSCNIKPITALDKDKKSIDVKYRAKEGDLSYLNEIRITGNTKTKDVVIRRELRLYPGERFDGKKLKKSKQRLYDLGYFDEVIFDTEPTQAPDKKDLVVSVKEAKTGEFSFGGGYSSVDRLLGFVEVTQRNFDIMNFPTLTGAGQILNIRAEVGSVRQNYILSFTEPWIFGYPYLFGFDLFNFDRDKKTSLGYGYAERRTGGNLRFGKEFTDYDRADLKYRLESVKISDVSSDATTALKDEEGKNIISSLSLTLTRNTTDNRYNPTEGHILSITGEDAGGLFGGDKDFYKAIALADQFFHHKIYDKKLVLELKGRAGWSEEYDNTKSVPLYERFFAGGANTVRGYKERSIGPRDAVTNDPIGGESMLIGNAELTYPIFKNFKIATFYDIGNVWEKSYGIFKAGDFKSGTGVGVRVKTPIGPISVDAGYPLDEASPGDKKKIRFHFNMSRGF